MHKKTILAILLMITGPAYADSDDSIKLFAGTFADAEALRTILQRDELTMTQAERSVVPCNVGTSFGIVYMLKIDRGMQKERDTWTFMERWDHPSISIEGQTHSVRELSVGFEKRHSGPQFAGWQLEEKSLADGDLVLTIARGDEQYLQHRFMVRGCSEDTRDELERLMQAASTDNTEVVCREETETGTRISKLVCRSRAEIELESNALRQELRRR